MLHVSRKDLERAYHSLSQVGGNPACAGERLLLIYAVESGLKALILADKKLQTSKQDDSLREHGHDIKKLMKQLRLPATCGEPKSTFTALKPTETILLKAVHEAWRYGRHIQPEEEKELCLTLLQIRKHISENI
jgi:hypothetical protein